MMINKVQNNINFQAIKLSEMELQKSKKLFEKLTSAVPCESEISKTKKDIFNLFNPYILKEAESKTKYYNIFKDVLSEIYLYFSEMLNDISNNSVESFIQKINEYKPSKDTIKPEYVHRTLNVSIYQDGQKKHKIDILTEKSLPVPESAAVIDKYKQRIDNTIEDSNISDKIKKRLKERAKGAMYKEIAESENVSAKSVGLTVKKAILQIQNKYGILPPELLKRVKIISKFLGCSEKDLIKAGITSPGLFYKSIENYEKNIREMSDFLGCTKEKYIEKYITNSGVLCTKPETLEKRIKIENYYKKVKNKQGKNVIRRESEKALYNKILAYLIKKYSKNNPKVNIINIRQFDLGNFLKASPKLNKTFCYEIPDDEIAPEFIKYVQDTSVEAIGKNLFKFKIISQ